ncbi:MAG: ATP-binding protein [Gemmatimonadota bacterium]|nr:ATP-binding protein [Gemmatimonadota bacterium]
MAGISALRKARWDPLQLSSRQLIKWWMLLRSSVVSTTMAVVYFMGTPEKPGAEHAVLPLMVAAVTIAVSFVFYRVIKKKGTPPESYFFLQYFFDICIICMINLVSLAADMSFIPLYVMSIAVAGILSFQPGAYFTATLASFFYLPFGLGVFSVGFKVDRVMVMDILFTGEKLVLINACLQVALFYCIALITSYLSQRLCRTGWELEDVRKVLQQYRLDTNKILDNVATALVTCNSAGVIVYANPAAVRILGLGLDKLLNNQASELFNAACPEIGRIIDLALGSNVLVTRKQVSYLSQGGELPLVVSSSLLLEQGDAVHGVSLIFEDVTHEIKARQLELRSGKLEAVAELSAGLAHEIKNPLSSIRSAVELLRESAGRPEDGQAAQTRRLMDCVISESDRLTELLRQFLQFASGSFGPAGDEVVLGPLLKQVLCSVGNHPDWRRDIEVTVSPAVAKMRVQGHQNALNQVFSNLIINSAQALGPGGERTGKIVVEPCPQEAATHMLDRAGNQDYHLLCLSDDGPGIQGSLREKVFEPFFSSRPQGFGLGLAVVHRIVHALGGIIYVEACPPGQGASFLIALKRHDGAGT